MAGPYDASGGARKIVTILFSDIVGFTDLAERFDPETMRAIMNRYFDEMTPVLERHGGTIEKLIGDAIMAVFGIPRLHEDDALRAVRAAVEMRDGLPSLNEGFDGWGVKIVTRTGVNTGEVAAGDPARGESFVAGDAVNVAARLEQAAEPGEILIGEATYRLVRNAATADPVPPLMVKGRVEPVAAWRLRDVAPGVPGWVRRLDSPLVGRNRELELLEDAYRRSVDGGTCELVTCVGPAGVGKSRLSYQFLSTLVSDTRILRGRCLPYGEGITFWPIVEVLREAAGIGDRDSPEEARPKILELLEPGGDSLLIGDRIAALLGLSDVMPGIHETFWAVRKLLEQMAAHGPLVVVLDDIHWGESTFLDLLEYLVDWVSDAPVLLLCLARSDLLEVRAGWMRGRANASLISLLPLTDRETEGLIQNLLSGAQLAESARGRIAELAEGNPLFVEETLRMLVDDGLLQPVERRWTVVGDLSTLTIPPTIQALLTARLDRLDDEERAVIERASVMGRMFWWGAVSELSPPERRSGVDGHLRSLIRKELIRPDHSDLREEDAFRFTHILIRDAAYRGIPKASRAELHERFAGWIEAKSQGRAGQYEELVGYHLEQAHRSLSELRPTSGGVEPLGRRAAVPLASAGRRAFARGDMPAAVNLLSRAASLTPANDQTRFELLVELAFALLETGDFPRLQEIVAETGDAAAASADPGHEAHALILGLWVRLFTDPEGWAEEAQREATSAISAFEVQGDERGLARAWSLLGLFHLTMCQFATAEEAWEKAAAYALAAGNHREALESLSWVPLCAWGGPTPAKEAIRLCEQVLARADGDRKVMSTALFTRGKLEAMSGRFGVARELVAKARSILQEVALTVWMSGPLTQMTGWVELLAGDPLAAERSLRPGVETLREIGELAWLSTTAAILAEALYAQGRDDEAQEYLVVGQEAAGAEDAYSQALLRSVGAKVLARRGRVDEAVTMAREAVTVARTTDSLFILSVALMSLGQVLLAAGEADEATTVLDEARDVCERKGFVVGKERAGALLEGVSPRRS